MKIKASRLGLDTYKCSWQGVSGIVIKSGPDLMVDPGLDWLGYWTGPSKTKGQNEEKLSKTQLRPLLFFSNVFFLFKLEILFFYIFFSWLLTVFKF